MGVLHACTPRVKCRCPARQGTNLILKARLEGDEPVSEQETPNEYYLYAIVTDEGDIVDAYTSEKMARDELDDDWGFLGGTTPDRCRVIALVAKEAPGAVLNGQRNPSTPRNLR